MAQYDVFRLADGGLVVDCQNDRLEEIGTRFVLPLMPAEYAPPPQSWLNPSMMVDDEEVLLVPQFAMSIRTGELRRRVGTLAPQRDQIVRAMDRLTGTG